MNISEQQIDQLYHFTRAHYVEHYDVQSELVDHLANGIEAIWEQQPNLSFEQARDQSFKKFGVFGFMGVVEEKQKQMSNKYWRFVWGIFKDFFRVPQIILTATIILGLYTSLQSSFQNWIIAAIGLGGCLIMILKAFQIKKMVKERFKATGKKWLLEEHIYGFGNFVGAANLFVQFIFISKNITSDIVLFSMAFLITVFVLIIYITVFIIPSNIESYLKNEYPDYKSVTI